MSVGLCINTNDFANGYKSPSLAFTAHLIQKFSLIETNVLGIYTYVNNKHIIYTIYMRTFVYIYILTVL